MGGEKVISLIFPDHPIAMEPENQYCQAILPAWNSRTIQSGAAAEVLVWRSTCRTTARYFLLEIAQLPDFEDYRI